jgi:hypothetical protein
MAKKKQAPIDYTKGDQEANRRTRNAVERGNWLHGVLEDLWNGEDIEHHLESKGIDYAGTFDMLAVMKDERIVLLEFFLPDGQEKASTN